MWDGSVRVGVNKSGIHIIGSCVADSWSNATDLLPLMFVVNVVKKGFEEIPG